MGVFEGTVSNLVTTRFYFLFDPMCTPIKIKWHKFSGSYISAQNRVAETPLSKCVARLFGLRSHLPFVV